MLQAKSHTGSAMTAMLVQARIRSMLAAPLGSRRQALATRCASGDLMIFGEAGGAFERLPLHFFL